MKIVIKELDEDWAVRERYILTRCGDSLPSYTQALIDTVLAHPGHTASRSRRTQKSRGVPG